MHIHFREVVVVELGARHLRCLQLVVELRAWHLRRFEGGVAMRTRWREWCGAKLAWLAIYTRQHGQGRKSVHVYN
jgi:hypothetical protein